MAVSLVLNGEGIDLAVRMVNRRNITWIDSRLLKQIEYLALILVRVGIIMVDGVHDIRPEILRELRLLSGCHFLAPGACSALSDQVVFLPRLASYLTE